MYIDLRVFLDRRNMNFLDRCSKNNQASNFMKLLTVGAELFCADERTGIEAEANSRFLSKSLNLTKMFLQYQLDSKYLSLFNRLNSTVLYFKSHCAQLRIHVDGPCIFLPLSDRSVECWSV
jgi:hypothetical protein